MLQIRADISPASNQQRIKNQNATLLFDLVRRLSPISRAALTKTSGLSAASVRPRNCASALPALPCSKRVPSVGGVDESWPMAGVSLR